MLTVFLGKVSQEWENKGLRCGKKNGKKATGDLQSKSSTMFGAKGRITLKGTLEDCVFSEIWHEPKLELKSETNHPGHSLEKR